MWQVLQQVLEHYIKQQEEAVSQKYQADIQAAQQALQAYEVIDGEDGTLEASGSNDFVTKTATCYFKGSYTKRPKGRMDYDCYSNVCRQGVDRIEW